MLHIYSEQVVGIIKILGKTSSVVENNVEIHDRFLNYESNIVENLIVIHIPSSNLPFADIFNRDTARRVLCVAIR